MTKSVAYWLVAVLVAASLGYAQYRRTHEGGVIMMRQGAGGVGTLSWVQTAQFTLAQQSALPPCSVSISGTLDTDCVAQCLAYGDGGVNCYDNTGAPIGTMTQPTAGVNFSNGPVQSPDGGWFAEWNFPDDTISLANGLVQFDSAAIRNMMGSPWAIVYEGYIGSTAPDPTGWVGMITDGTNQVQIRRGGPANFQAVVGPPGNVAASGGDCFDNWCTLMVKNDGDGGFSIQQGGNKSAEAATSIANIGGTNKWILGGGIGVCCSPGGSQGGIFGSTTFYNTNKSDAFYQQVNKAAGGAQAVASGPITAVGNLGVRLARYDLDKPGGGLSVLGIGDYMMDYVKGGITNQTYHLLGPVDMLDGGSLIGDATWRGAMDKGPLFNWRHKNSAGWFSMETGVNPAGMIIGAVGGDGGIMSTNASIIATALTDGGYAVGSTYWIQNICGGGTIDGGFDHCTGTVAGNAVFARYPTDGCPMQCFNATGLIESILYVGDAGSGQTAALELQQIQMTDTLELEEPSTTNQQVSAQYLEFDAGSYIPAGCNAGKICAVFTSMFSSAWYPPPPVNSVSALTPPGTGAYIFDLSTAASSHDMLVWQTVENTTETQAAGNASTLDSVMYGIDPAYITPNKFAQGGQYDGAPFQYATQTYYGTCLEWDVEFGTLPDGGSGFGSRAILRANACPDQTNPFNCPATVIVNNNTGQMGLCPGTPDTFEVGTRQLGSSPSTSRVHHISVCRCNGAKCQGNCL